MRVAVYCRVSTDKEIQKDSLISQKQMANEKIASEGWTLFDYYEEVASGTRSKRPELQRMLADAREKKFDLILTKELSRLARNGQLSYEIRNVTSTNNIYIQTFDNLIDTKNGNEFTYGIFSAVYEQESKSTSGRIKSVYATKARNGEYLASVPPLGYRIVNKQLIAKEDETPDLVRRIFREYIEGKGHDAIARSLYEEGFKTPSAYANKTNATDVWHGSSIRRILTNPHYTGDLVQNRSSTKNLFTDARNTHDASELIIVENTHEAIISKEDFQLTQRLIEQRKVVRPQSQIRLWSNILFCADCGRGMHYKKNSKGFVCGNFNKHGNKKCTNHLVREVDLMHVVTEEFQQLFVSLNNEHIYGILRDKIASKEKSSHKQVPALERELNDKKALRGKLFERYVEDSTIKEMYHEKTNILNIEIQQIEVVLESLKNDNLPDKELKIFESLRIQLEKALSFQTITADALNRFIEKIEIKADGSPRIHYRFSEDAAFYLLNSNHAQHST